MDVYTTALDRQVIANREWQNGRLRYIKIGRQVYQEDGTKVEMLFEKDTDQWTLGEQVTRWYKLKFRIRLMLDLWEKTK